MQELLNSIYSIMAEKIRLENNLIRAKNGNKNINFKKILKILD